MPRFYLPHRPDPDSEYSLPDKIIRHIQVLRLRIGNTLTLFDGNGRESTAVLTALDRRHAACRILNSRSVSRESPLHITLIQALSSGERMDYTLQKSIELGVTAVMPVISTRSVVRLDGERAHKRLLRWQEIAAAACEQCGRNHLPKILTIHDFEECIAQLPSDGSRFLLSPKRARSIRSIQPAPQKLYFMVGPEGGWSQAEEQQAEAAGFQALTLGPRILRTETAAPAAIAAMQTLWGDLG